MAWKFNPFTGSLNYYEPGDEPGTHNHTESDITDLSHLALGETETTAYRGDRGVTAYNHSQAAHADADADNTATNETSHADVLVTGDVDDTPVNGVTDAPVSSNWAYDHAASHAPSNADNTAANETSHANVLETTDVDDTPVNGATTAPVSSNWAFDHDADADAHHAQSHNAASHSDVSSTGAQIDAAVSASHTESHAVASHSDTTATGAELNELTDGSETTLHSHAGGGSDKVYASFYLSTGGVTAVAATATTLTINQTSVNSDTDVFTLSSSTVTVDKTADFEVSAQCYFNTGGSSRSEYTMWLENDSTEVAGTRTGTYQRGYDSGDTAGFSIIVSITSGDVLRLRIQRTDGGATTGYQDDNGTRLTIKEM